MKRCVVVSMSLLIISLTLFAGCSETTPVVRSLNLITDIIIVEVESYYDIPFSATEGARVQGVFEASQHKGMELDRIGNTGIEFLILDDITFTNWINQQPEIGRGDYYPEDALYADKDERWVIDVEIPTTGIYHLIFSNKDSEFISKRVTTKFDLN